MKLRTNLLLLLFTTSISLFLGEMLLRFLAVPEGFNHHQLYCEYDPLLGWRKQANITGHHHTPEYEVWEQLNTMGIRGPEYPVAKDSGETRILILGDSFAEGYTVGFDSLFSEILKDSLQGKCPGGNFQVTNTGTGGWSTDQELLYFEKEGGQFQPDFTILMFCINDPWYNNQASYWRGSKPLFKMAGDSLSLTNVPVPQPGSGTFFQKVKAWLMANSELVKRLKNAKDKLYYKTSENQLPDEWKVFRAQASPEIEEAWKITSALLARLKRSNEAVGSQLLVFYIPEKIEVYEDSWQGFLETYSLDAMAVDKKLPRNNLQFICNDLQIPLLDPTDFFVQYAKEHPDRRLYFQNDWHWNVEGNRLVGKLLNEAIYCDGYIFF